MTAGQTTARNDEGTAFATAFVSTDGTTAFAGPVDRILVGTLDGVVELLRSPANRWQRGEQTLQGQHISALFLEPTRGGIFAGVHGEGLFLSVDGGTTWQPRTKGLSSKHIYTLACGAGPEGPILYAGTEPAHLYRSRTYGEEWEELPAVCQVPGTDKWMFPPPPHIAHVKTIAVDPRNPLVLYVGVEQGALLKSRDGGDSWRELDSYYQDADPVYKDIHRLVLLPSNPDKLFMTSGMGLYHSPDGGETWVHLTNTNFSIGYPDQLLISPIDDRTMFMAGAGTDPGKWFKTHRADAMVMRSDDRGNNWYSTTRGFPEDMRANITAMSLMREAERFALFAGTTNGDVFMSGDEGVSWSLIVAGLPPISKAAYWPRLLTA